MSNLRYIACLLAFILFMYPTPGKAAQAGLYAANDLLLFFQNPAGTTGTDKVVYFNLGSTFNVFRDAATPDSAAFGSTIPLGNINTILTSTYGADWTSLSSSIFLAATGQNGSTSATSTGTSNGDFARTVYITKPRTSAGSVGQANSSSPLYPPSQTAVAGQINGANNINGMTQPGAVLADGTATTGNTLLDDYNPFFNGNPATAYGAINGGLMGFVTNSSYTFGSVSGVVVALDLYRVAKTSGTGTTSASIWHNANNIAATLSNDFGVAGGGSAAAYYLGTITLSSDGSVNFVARQAEPAIALTGDDLTGMTTSQGAASTHRNLTIVASNLGTSNLSIALPPGFEVSTNGGASYATTGTIAPTSGAVNATVRVRIAATATQGSLGGNVSVSAGSKSETKPISGTVGAPAPSVALSGTFSTFTTTAGTPSAVQTFSVSGSNLTGNLGVTAPSGFELRRAGSGTYGSSTTISPVSGTVAATSMEIRIAAATPAGFLTGGVITVASTGATPETRSVSGTVNAAPSLTVSPASLSGFSATQGTASAAQTFTVSGANLTGNVTVTAPTGFEVSSNGTSFGSTATVNESNGTASGTIAVRIAASAVAGSPSGSIGVASSGATSRSVAVSGTVVPPPSLSTSGSLTSFSTSEGTASAAQTFTVSGANLTGNVTVSAPVGFEVSADGTNFASSQTLTPGSGSLAVTTVSVRITSAAPSGAVSGNLRISSPGASEILVPASGVVGFQPAVSAVADFSAFSTTQGMVSAAQIFTVSGANLTGNVTITAPPGFEVSTDGTSFAASRTLTPVDGSLAVTTVSARIAASALAGSLNGDISLASPGAAEQTLAVNGAVVPPPSLSVSAAFSAFAVDPAIVPARVEPQGSVPAGYEKVSFSQPTSGGRGFFRVQASVPEPSPADDYAAWATGYPLAELQDQTADYDGDGFVNFSEYAFGTDPTKGNNSLSSVRLESGNVVVTFLRRAGLNYSVLKAVALSGGSGVLQTTQGTASAAQTFTVSGTNLTGDVTVTAPPGFDVSVGGSYSSSLNIVPVDGTLVTTSVSVRIAAATAEGSPSGDITISSPGAATRTVGISGTVSAPPSLTVAGGPEAFATTQGTASDAQTFTVGGARLTGNVTVTAPNGFEVSTNGTDFGTRLTLTPSGGNLSVTTISVRVAATATAGPLMGQIQIVSSGVSPRAIEVVGDVAAVPRVDVTGSLVSFSTSAGTASPEQTLIISGSNLTANVVVEVPPRFEVAGDSGEPFGTSITLAPSSGSLNKTIFVRAAASEAGTYSGDLAIISQGANSRLLGVFVTVSPPPSLAVSAQFSPFSATFGSPSATQSLAVTGAHLTGDVRVSSPAGFELSIDGSVFLPTQSIMPQNGVAAATVHVRLRSGAATGSYAGIISVESTGAQTQSLPVSGAVVPVPLLSTTGIPSALQTLAGSSSSSQTFTISGSHLVGAVTLTAPAGFELAGQQKPFAPSIILSPSFGTLDESIMVRLARSDIPGTLSGNIIAASPGANSVQVPVEGTVLPRPSLSIVGSPTAFSASRNQPSPSQSVVVSGSDLSAAASVTAPSGFQVSADNIVFSSRVQFSPSGGILSARNVWIRLAPNSTAGSYGGNVTLSSTGATTRALSVAGTVN